jgi:hypothetical protein
MVVDRGDEMGDASDLRRAFAAMARIDRAARREQANERMMRALRLKKKAERAGYAVASLTVDDVTLTFDKSPKAPTARAPAPAADGDITEWDREFGSTSPPQARQ